jgi:uncharacterized protein YkwD
MPSAERPTEGDALKRLRLPLSLALASAVFVTAAPQPASAARSFTGKGMMDAVNSVRAKYGLRQLKRARRLVRSSASRAELMMRGDFFAHPSTLSVPTFDRVGEILELHGGRRPRMGRTIRLWLHSTGHRAVMLSSHYRWIGAARAVGLYGGHRATIWVVRFGKH